MVRSSISIMKAGWLRARSAVMRQRGPGVKKWKFAPFPVVPGRA
jgi:hypothetical protein